VLKILVIFVLKCYKADIFYSINSRYLVIPAERFPVRFSTRNRPLCYKTPGHLSAWAGLKPRNDESAKKFKSRKILPGNPYLKSILVQTAWAAVASRKSSFHDWFWSHQLRLGKKKTIIAVSRKILVLIYVLVVRGDLYNPEIAFARKI